MGMLTIDLLDQLFFFSLFLLAVIVGGSGYLYSSNMVAYFGRSGQLIPVCHMIAEQKVQNTVRNTPHKN